jgi:hypothetical protein
MSFEPEIIMAYVDGELDLLTAKRIEKAMEGNAALAARVASERVLRARLSARFDPVMEEEVPARLTALLANIDTSMAARREDRKRRFGFGPAQWGAVAASLVLGLIVGRANLAGSGGPIAERNGTLVASASLKTALDTQLASNQPASAATHVGLTFRDKSGAICRTFESQALSGIACRGAAEWQLRQTISTPGAKAEYRQAASGLISEAASSMMAGSPMDAEAERTAQARDWR